MRRAPVGALPEHEAAARKKLQDVVPRLENLALKRLAAANDVADPLLGLARNAHRHQFAGTIEARELAGVALVILALHAWPLRNERGSDYVTCVAPLPHRAM